MARDQLRPGSFLPRRKSLGTRLVEDLRPVALSSIVAKAQESFAVRWIYDDTVEKISDSQYGGLMRSSTINALVNLTHKWHKSMDEMERVIRIVFLDFCKAFDLIDHNKLLENMKEKGVRSILIRWFASYLNERSHFTQFGKEASDFVYVIEGVLQGSKLGPIVFVTKINMLPNVIEQVAQGVNDVVDEDTILFMHDTTSWEALDVHNHGNISKKIDLVKTLPKARKWS